ncbi:MAG TPA: RluA family pseudouridine synthase [Candidatus Paceibacterota bacterium]
MNPEILFDHEHFVVLNKPAGMLVHSDGRSTEKTVVDFFLQQFPASKGVGEEGTVEVSGETIVIERSGVVHRLDLETSGVLVMAKTAQGYEVLKDHFQNHTISKHYKAFVYGHPSKDRGLIDRPIGRSASNFKNWSATRGARGQLREAQTRYNVLKKGFARSSWGTEKVAYLTLQLLTGRTHQIRVHMKALNHPVVGDDQYAGALAHQEEGVFALEFKRVALHAHTLSFEFEGKTYDFEAPLPADFEHALANLKAEAE